MQERKYCGIYRIEDRVSGEFYIGASADIDTRWVQHQLELRRGKHINGGLQAAWNRDGEAAFVCRVVELVRDPFIEMVRVERERIREALDQEPAKCLNILGRRKDRGMSRVIPLDADEVKAALERVKPIEGGENE